MTASRLFILVVVTALNGCSAAQQRAETITGVGEAVGNPDKTEAHYDRDGADVNFLWIKCGGTYCDAYRVTLPEGK